MLARRDIDAVVIATPDHWHAIPSILAARAHKDVYCEKPLSLTIAEGRAMVTAAREHNIVFQTGSQQRTEFGGNFRKAVEYVRSGRIGPVRTIRIGVGGPNRPCNLPNEATPEGTDWEMWNGPSPARAYNHELCPNNIHSHFPIFRHFREYANGMLGDMGAHHFDIAQWALNMDTSAPTEIHPPERGDTGLRFVYANGIEMFHGGNVDCRFEGTEGRVIEAGLRPYLRSTPAEIVRTPLGAPATSTCPTSATIIGRTGSTASARATGRSPTLRSAPEAPRSASSPTSATSYCAGCCAWDPECAEGVRGQRRRPNRLRSRENRTPWDRTSELAAMSRGESGAVRICACERRAFPRLSKATEEHAE